MKNLLLIVVCVAMVIPFVFGCTTTQAYKNKRNTTVGVVQKEIRIGMSSSEVVEVLGAPNMITTDEERRECWVYDKISTEIKSSSSSSTAWALLFVHQRNSGSYSSSQRTLTIIIKFDKESRVRDFAYRTSSF